MAKKQKQLISQQFLNDPYIWQETKYGMSVLLDHYEKEIEAIDIEQIWIDLEEAKKDGLSLAVTFTILYENMCHDYTGEWLTILEEMELA